MLYATHLLPRGYLYTKFEMSAINIVGITERTRIHLQTKVWLLKKRKKNRQKFKYANIKKPGTYVKVYPKYDICVKYEGFSIKIGIRNAKKVKITRNR